MTDQTTPSIEEALHARVLELEENLANAKDAVDHARRNAGEWRNRAYTAAQAIVPTMVAAHDQHHNAPEYPADWRRCHGIPCRLLAGVNVEEILAEAAW